MRNKESGIRNLEFGLMLSIRQPLIWMLAARSSYLAALNPTSTNPRLTDAVGQETSEISFYV